jgi:PAS domain S-box-containing protein
MKKNKNNLSETIQRPKYSITPTPGNENEASVHYSDINLLSLIQKLMEQQEDLAKQISELQSEKEFIKTNSERLLILCQGLASLGQGQSHDFNLNYLTSLCGKLLSATCAIYDRLEDGYLHSVGQWNVPADYKTKNIPEGHLCYDVILGNQDEAMLISNLSQTVYLTSDPSVSKYGFQTYFGQVVRCQGIPVGALCAIYETDVHPTDEDRQILKLISEAIGNEDARKLVDLARQETQRLLNETEAISKIGGWEYSIAKKKLTWTNEVSRIYGVNADYNADNLENAFEFYSGDDHQKIKQAFTDALEKGIPYDLELRFHSRDGKQKWVRTIGYPVFDHGRITKIAGNIVDTTERKNAEFALKESEARFHTLLDKVTNIAVQGYGPNGTVRYWNKASERIYGYTAEEAIGKNLIYLIIPPEIRKEVIKDIHKMIETGIGIPAAELQLMRKDGSLVPVLSSHTVIQVPGNDKELFCIDIDLSERIQAQEALKKSEVKLKELNVSKDKLFSIIAHDLRTPFNSILGFTDLLLDNIREYDIEKVEKYLTHINLQARSSYNLLENLLMWGKSKSNQIIFKPENVYLPTYVAQIIESLQASASTKNIQLSVANTPDTLLYIDATILNIILRNLISNSIKYTHQGGKIEVSVRNLSNEIEFRITDNGIGMSLETQKKLFRQDTNFSTEGTSNEKGTGLGLILCMEFIEKLQGKIWVESELGKGSTFFFTIPL